MLSCLLTVWLTPSLLPVYGATYLPNNDYPSPLKLGAGFVSTLLQIAELWHTKPREVQAVTDQSYAQLDQIKHSLKKTRRSRLPRRHRT